MISLILKMLIYLSIQSRPLTASNPSRSRNAAAKLSRYDSAEPFDEILESPKHDMCESAQITLFTTTDPKTIELSKSKKSLQLDLCHEEDVTSQTIHQYPKTCGSRESTPITTTIQAMPW